MGDYLHRAFYSLCRRMGADQAAAAAAGGGGWSGPKGGDIAIAPPCQHILEQSAVSVRPDTGDIIAQFTLNLPARGRTILGSRAVDIFERVVPTFVAQSLVYRALDTEKLRRHVDSVEDQRWLRYQLEGKGLVAFVPNGAILPRSSGAEDTPMVAKRPSSSTGGDAASVVPFQSPETLHVSFHLPNINRTITGMGIPTGVTLIVGGGFHGKSTLLAALQYGIYDKIPGDGREFCVTDESATKVRAEDGRFVSSVDISPFVSNLPYGKGTNDFSTMDASGSTSQASNIVEALEMGSKALLIDEDTCATNFMIRDDKMIELISPDEEPITPFVRKIRSLYEDKGVSTILVVGGTGDYFDVSDHVIAMKRYRCLDVTERAKEIATKANASKPKGNSVSQTPCLPFGNVVSRCPRPEAFQANDKVSVRSKTVIAYGDVEVDLSGLEQIVSQTQTNSISAALQSIPTLALNGTEALSCVLSKLDSRLDKDGLDSLAPGQFHGGFARPRAFEIAGAINRLRRDNSMVQKGNNI